MATKNKKVMLIILDGWGIAGDEEGNAIFQAKTPTIDMIERSYFSVPLQASGIAVGLPWGEEGNSEVGHMNIGAGFTVYQYLPRITGAIRDGTFFQNKALRDAIAHVQKYNSRLHIMGLVGSGTVHSSLDHLVALLELAQQNSVKEVVVHAFTDGKDSGKKEGRGIIEHLEQKLTNFSYPHVGSIIGRVYAMDRNNNWELTQKTYELLTGGVGHTITDTANYLETSYDNNITDYDIEPATIEQSGVPIPHVSEDDALIFFNFREDSARQLTQAFITPDAEFTHFERTKLNNLFFVSMTEYSKKFPIAVAYPPPQVVNPLAKVVSDAGKKQLHVAETEKYAHVTFFINGEHEDPYPGEERILVRSEGGPHHENNPKMQAYTITQKFLENIEMFDFFLINLANADMLAHTGNLAAAIEGIEVLDANISALYEAAKKFDITLLITSDHGNAEEMLNPKTGSIVTKHTKNPVPCYIVGEEFRQTTYKPLLQQKPQGILADIAPTILKLLGLDAPAEMTGKPLI